MAVVSVTVVPGIEVAKVVGLSPEYVLMAQVKAQAIGPCGPGPSVSALLQPVRF